MVVSELVSWRSVGLSLPCRIAEWWAKDGIEIVVVSVEGLWSKIWGKALEYFIRKLYV